MVFVFDLDDTVCDTDGYSEEFILKFFNEHNLPYKKIKDISRFADGKFDWTEEQALEWYKSYGDKMMREFPDKYNAVSVINKLYDAGHTIVIATARANDWHTDPEGNTLYWLQSKGLKYHKLYMGRVDKEEICLTERADVFIDDDISLTQKVVNREGNENMKVFLSSTPYNKTVSAPQGVIRVESISEMVKKVLG